MRINQINFKSGYLYNEGTYINPKTIYKIKPNNNNKNETRVIYTDKSSDIFQIPIDSFVSASLQALNSDDCIDISNCQ